MFSRADIIFKMSLHNRFSPKVFRLVFVSLPLCVLIFSSGCSPAGQNGRVRSDLTRVEVGLQDLRSLQAEHAAQISALEGQLRSVLAELERVQYAMPASGSQAPQQLDTGHSHQAAHRAEGRPSTDLTRFPTNVPPPIVPLGALEADERITSQLPPEPGRILRNALIRVREGAYREALPLLDQGYQMSFGMEWQTHFMFWRAVCFDGMGDNPRALGAYHDLVSQHPRHERTALALLRQASVFVRLGDTDTARLTLQKLVADFPQSQEAERARERLRTL